MAEQAQTQVLHFLQFISLLPASEKIWERAMAIEYGITSAEAMKVEHSRQEWDQMLQKMKDRPTKVSEAKPNKLTNFVPLMINGRISRAKRRPF